MPNKRVVPIKHADTKYQVLPTLIFTYCYVVPYKREFMDFFPAINKRAACLLGTPE